MKKIYIVHGWGGSSQRDWMPWTTNELVKLGYEVVTFDMPHPESPTIEDWVGYLKNNITSVDESTFFIGHSIGCQTILRYLQDVKTKIGGAFFVAGWFDLENLENKDSEDIAKPWIETNINFEKVNQVLPWSVVILGDDDAWVPHNITKEKFESHLNSEVLTIPNGGHITSDNGFGSFPRLVAVLHRKVSNIELLEVVKDDGAFDYLETRKKIHQEGLLHKEIHIWFITPKSEIVFQHRAKDTDTYPDKLDATVGGHVDPGMTYEETVSKECKEETGIDVDMSKIVFVREMRKKIFDESTNLTNNTIRAQYAYLYEGQISDLQIEEDKCIGFETWSISGLSSLSDKDKNRFIPAILRDDFISLFNDAVKLLKLK